MAASVEAFPVESLIPKRETGVTALLSAYPDGDGRNVRVAVLDTGVDPGALNLAVTSQGTAKVVDLIDATGSGDVDTATIKTIDADGAIVALSGSTYKVPASWTVADNQVRVGLKASFELFPSGLVRRLKSKRQEGWTSAHGPLLAQAEEKLAAFDKAHPKPSEDEKAELKELQARVDVLHELAKTYEDHGPVYDCFVWHDGECLQACIHPVGSDAELGTSPVMTDYKVAQQHAMFSDYDRMNYSFNIYDNGAVLSIVTDSGSHGTHVAGIVAACKPADPAGHGVAPGAEIVGIKIGDSRLGSMETGTGLVRGVLAAVRAGCDIINLSFGEATTLPDKGRIVETFKEAVKEHGLIFACSAGNNGPALSTVGCPGGTSSYTIGVGAYASVAMMQSQYSLQQACPNNAFTWSSRGPAPNGALGVSFTAPGGAISDVPNWNLHGSQLMNGTSMSCPNASGAMACLLSVCKQAGVPYTPHSIKRALENTAASMANNRAFDVGQGVIQVDKAFAYLQAHQDVAAVHAYYSVDTTCCGKGGKGVYMRELDTMQETVVSASITITPEFNKKASSQEQIDFEIQGSLVSTAAWLTGPKHVLLGNSSRSFAVKIDRSGLRPGVHYAECQLLDSRHPTAGPLVRVPVTVIVPEVLKDRTLSFNHVQMGPGDIKEHFVIVPATATSCQVTLTLAGTSKESRRLSLHAVQLSPKAAYNETEFHRYMIMSANESNTVRFKVRPGRCLEVNLAQWWSSAAASDVHLEVTFTGVLPLTKTLALCTTSSPVAVEVFSGLEATTIAPAAKLSTLRRFLRPSSATVGVKPGLRNTMFDQRQVHALVLDYSFELSEKLNVKPWLAGLSEVLYESQLESQFMLLTNEHGQVMLQGDAFGRYNTDLDKGLYKVTCEIRSDDLKLLDKQKTTALMLDLKLKKPVSIDIGRTPAVCGGGKVNYKLPVGSTTRFFLQPPTAPKLAEAGDVLTGTLTILSEKDPHADNVTVEVVCMVGPKPVKESKKTPKPAAPSDADKFKTAKIKLLMDAPDGDDSLDGMRAALKDDAEYLKAQLEKQSKTITAENAEQVLELANRVQEQLDMTALAVYLGTNHDNETDEEQLKISKQHQNDKATLVKLLAAKVSASAALKDKEGTASSYTELLKWTKADDTACLEAVVAQHVLQEQHGQALVVLLKNRKKLTKEQDEQLDVCLDALGLKGLRAAEDRLVLKPPVKALLS